MKRKRTALLLSLSLCLALTVPAYAASGEVADTSTITVSAELKPGYYLCAVWHGDTLLRLFDYTAGNDGKLEATVEIGIKLNAGEEVTVGISNANTNAPDAEPIPPVVCKADNTSSGNSNTPSGPSASDTNGQYPDGDNPSAPATHVTPPNVTEDQTAISPANPPANSQTTHKGGGKHTVTAPDSNINVDTKLSPAAQMVFTDVAPDAFYADAVTWAVEKGITNGYGSATTFGPDSPCTRAQIVTFLWRACGSASPRGGDGFTDVPPGQYYIDAVYWAVENGITNGTNEAGDTFSPDMICTRAQIATFLWRAAGSPAPAGAVTPFIDVRPDAYYYQAVLWCAEHGITLGTNTAGTTFSPDMACSRAQIVTFLYRADRQ